MAPTLCGKRKKTYLLLVRNYVVNENIYVMEEKERLSHLLCYNKEKELTATKLALTNE